MRSIIVYDPETRLAKFTYHWPFPEGITDLLDNLGHNYVDLDTPIPIHRLYFDENMNPCEISDFNVKVNKTMILDDDKDVFQITGIPDNTEIYVDGNLQGTFSGTFSLVSSEQGTYTIKLVKPFYSEFSIDISVVAELN